MKKHQWVFPTYKNPESIRQLGLSLKLPSFLSKMLVSRGVETMRSAHDFFNHGFSDLHGPFLMRDMSVAVERIIQAIKQEEGILIFGDYDVDGTTSTAILVSFLKSFGAKVNWFIPSRFKHGYGLSEKAVAEIISHRPTLVITVDCGITGHKGVNTLNTAGIDVIITDHHTVSLPLPNAVAILNPKRLDCKYPFKELSGCGVAFKLIQALLQKAGRPAEKAKPFLDLVALSIASDMVPMTGENRILMREGLSVLRSKPRRGLEALSERTGQNLDHCSTSQIVFNIGPRINAAGRMGDAGPAVELFLSQTIQTAKLMASRLESVNTQRRLVDQETIKEAIQMMEESPETCMQHAIVLYNPDWHLGVLGIVASKLAERYHRPAIILGRFNGQAKGSSRSFGGFNLYQALQKCESLLGEYGGHIYAAGLSLATENVEKFRKAFNQVAKETKKQIMVSELKIDAEITFKEITTPFLDHLKKFSPFGPENKVPVFSAKNLTVVGQPAIVGKGGHLKFRVMQKPSKASFETIGFGMHAYLPILRQSTRENIPFEMAFLLHENHHNGYTTLQLRARDIRIPDKTN